LACTYWTWDRRTVLAFFLLICVPVVDCIINFVALYPSFQDESVGWAWFNYFFQVSFDGTLFACGFWLLIIVDRILVVITQVLGKLVPTSSDEQNFRTREFVRDQQAEIDKNSKTFVSCLVLAFLLSYAHAFLGSLNTDVDSGSFNTKVSTFAVISAAIVFLLYQLVQINRQDQTFLSGMLSEYKKKNEPLWQVDGLMRYFERDPLQYEVLGVAVTTTTVTGCAVAALGSLAGALNNQIQELIHSGYV